MGDKCPTTVGLVWSQFAPYHVDRCEAVGAAFGDEARVLGIEVATGSRTYAWAPSGPLEKAEKITLFPGRVYEDISVWARFRALLGAARRCDAVFFGIGYNETHIPVLALILRLMGKRVIMMSDSKFDDKPRHMGLELFKALIAGVFHGALVAGHRQALYMRFLGFRRRPVRLGYDGISVARVRAMAAQGGMAEPDWQERPFVYVGRLVEKKNLFVLLRAYALYAGRAGAAARRLVLVGDGPLRDELMECAGQLGVADRVAVTGFLQAPEVAVLIAGSLALLLVSQEEQWGLVVNEAVALGIPVIVSQQVGACDLLVENLINGLVVEGRDVAAIAGAMTHMARDEKGWNILRQGAVAVTDWGDTSFFARSVREMTSR